MPSGAASSQLGHTCTHRHAHRRSHRHMHTDTPSQTHAHTDAHRHMHADAYTDVHTDTHTLTHTQMHTDMCTQTRAHRCTHTRVKLCLPWVVFCSEPQLCPGKGGPQSSLLPGFWGSAGWVSSWEGGRVRPNRPSVLFSSSTRREPARVGHEREAGDHFWVGKSWTEFPSRCKRLGGPRVAPPCFPVPVSLSPAFCTLCLHPHFPVQGTLDSLDPFRVLRGPLVSGSCPGGQS